MNHTPNTRDAPDNPDAPPLDPAQARLVARMRRLMQLSVAIMIVGVAAVLGVIGYRVFKGEGSRGAPEVTALVPQGARVVSATAAGDRLVVTLEAGGTTEIRTFDLTTLRPAGRLRFATEP